jgi:hypothetical protein
MIFIGVHSRITVSAQPLTAMADKKVERKSMSSSVSAANSTPPPQYEPPQRNPPGKSPTVSNGSPEDSVSLSQKAASGARAGDVDHDGDSH